MKLKKAAAATAITVLATAMQLGSAYADNGTGAQPDYNPQPSKEAPPGKHGPKEQAPFIEVKPFAYDPNHIKDIQVKWLQQYGEPDVKKDHPDKPAKPEDPKHPQNNGFFLGKGQHDGMSAATGTINGTYDHMDTYGFDIRATDNCGKDVRVGAVFTVDTSGNRTGHVFTCGDGTRTQTSDPFWDHVEFTPAQSLQPFSPSDFVDNAYVYFATRGTWVIDNIEFNGLVATGPGKSYLTQDELNSMNSSSSSSSSSTNT